MMFLEQTVVAEISSYPPLPIQPPQSHPTINSYLPPASQRTHPQVEQLPSYSYSHTNGPSNALYAQDPTQRYL